MAETRKPAVDFWNDHSLSFLEMAMKRDHQERVLNCDGTGTARRECGDTITFYLMASGGRLTAISYDIQGCLFTHACANTIIKLAGGKTLEAAGSITKTEILTFLETLPKAEAHCADLALKAFGLALADLDRSSV